MTGWLASPKRGTVVDGWGDPCPRATPASYPLRAACVHCGDAIVAVDGQAAWYHRRTRRIPCDSGV